MNGATPPRVRLFIAVLLLVYCAKQVMTVVLFPPFTGHDEVAHYEYVRILAREGRVPTLAADRLPGRFYEYRSYALQWRELGQWTTPLYTAVHPPLYYAAMVPVYVVARPLSPLGKQYLLRFAAIPFGIVIVLLAYRLSRIIFPDDGFLAVTVPVVVAFQPQVSYEAAIINNDVVAIALFSWLLNLLVLVVRDGLSFARAATVGCALGLGLLTKTTTAIAVPLIVGAFWLAGEGGSWWRRLRMLATSGGLALMLVAPWYAFMYATYGDLTGLRDLARIQSTLLRTDANFLQLLFSGDFAMERWKETWGEFGWRMIPVEGWLISTTAVITMVCGLGLAAFTLTRRARKPAVPSLEPWQRNALFLLGAACVIAYLAVVQFGTVFLLAQARYFFPAVNAAVLLAMLGARTLVPERHHGAAQMAVVVGSLAVNLIVYTSNVVPYFYFRP